ncbi:MAG: signal peptidase I [Lentisphaerae bacterium GWF2_45_14]|nr:MAG: signal peptidase I [Lentisphaerae bacterium GWF2_45_14]
MLFFRKNALKRLDIFTRHVRHRMHFDDDILSEQTKTRLDEVLIEAESLKKSSPELINKFLEDTPARLDKITPKKSFAAVREWVDILAVAFMVAFGIRALYLQPFKIPTSSMQPTLFGIHYVSKNTKTTVLPPPFDLFIQGMRKAKATVSEEGQLIPTGSGGFLLSKTYFNIGSQSYSLPGESPKVNEYAIKGRTYFEKGDVLCDGWLSTGDHLFVDRFSHHFTGLKRGDVTVFNTEGISYGGQLLSERGYYYIKRLIGLPGDTIRVKNNMVYIKPSGQKEEKPITDFNPAFKKIYSGKGGYHGHLNSPTATYLINEESTFTVPEDSYFMMGDNSANSLDGRYFGMVPRKNIVGRAFLVFWPFSRRWGIVDAKDPLDVPTTDRNTEMSMQ